MVLRLDDFAAFVANWEDKAGNIRRIQKTLNIGFDSLVFLDDNPFERNVVRNLLPDVSVPELPEDPALYLSFLQGLNLFETVSYSAADGARTRQYRQEAERTTLMETFNSYDDYLETLDMRAVAEPFAPFQYPRIAQLTQRSNQFNLRTVRFTEAQIEQAANDQALITRYYTLRDKFGDYGLIGVVILEKRPEDTLFVSTWLMSCRVLKRGMEEFIVNNIVETAKQAGMKRVVGEYLPTPKNRMVETIYERLGFAREGDVFVADPDHFSRNKTHIQPESGEAREQALACACK
jgi:FkbH-like protein